LPVASKLSVSEGKIILRRVFSDLLPESVFQRRKKGFEIPLEAWLRGPLNEFTQDTLSGDRLARHGLLNQDAVKNILSDLRAGRRFSASLLWSVLTFQVWHDRTFD
jgi:asparagine synthase (glutamine-hydrolysing)